MTLATPTRKMPSATHVQEFFADLLGRAVTASPVKETELSDGGAWVTGIFIEDDGTVGGASVMDLPLAAHAGASLAMIPSNVAAEAIKEGALSETLSENVGEVANIATGLLNGQIFPHLRMRELVDGVPDEVRDLLIKASGRRDLDMTIDDYGSGTLVLLAR
jgi:hypothetical protein